MMMIVLCLHVCVSAITLSELHIYGGCYLWHSCDFWCQLCWHFFKLFFRKSIISLFVLGLALDCSTLWIPRHWNFLFYSVVFLVVFFVRSNNAVFQCCYTRQFFSVLSFLRRCFLHNFCRLHLFIVHIIAIIFHLSVILMSFTFSKFCDDVYWFGTKQIVFVTFCVMILYKLVSPVSFAF